MKAYDKVLGRGSVEWINLVQDRNQLRAIANLILIIAFKVIIVLIALAWDMSSCSLPKEAAVFRVSP
jgi:hypothetical protein